VKKQMPTKEAELMQGLRHPNICSFFGLVHVSDGSDAIVLEFMNGGCLYTLLHWNTTVKSPIDDVALGCRIARETAAGLAYLHSKQCMHRDIKSLNILLDLQLHAKVADFGIAKLYARADAPPMGADRTVEAAASVNTVGQGTLRYMAPEVLVTDQQPGPGPTAYC
jgi:serine/threonine protein kinase